MVKKLRLVFIIIISIFIFSCKKSEIDEPAYIEIPSYKIIYKSNYANGGPGTTNHKFTDVKVTIKGKDYGIYPLPARVPVNERGECEVNISPIIKVNGVSTVRSEYAPIKLFDTTLTIASGNKHLVNPVFDYYANGVTFYWVEDFEVSGSSLIGDTAIKLQTLEKFEGAKAVKIELRNGQANCLAYSSSAFPLPNTSEMLYLEVNYKCNQSFEVGLFGGPELKPALTVSAQDSWNKIYIQLSNAVSNSPVYNTYKVYFKMVKTTDNPNPKLFLDNIFRI
jgi:hypothetical protein